MNKLDLEILRKVPSLYPDGMGSDLCVKGVSWDGVSQTLLDLKKKGFIIGREHYNNNPLYPEEWTELEITQAGLDALAEVGILAFLRRRYSDIISTLAFLISVFALFKS